MTNNVDDNRSLPTRPNRIRPEDLTVRVAFAEYGQTALEISGDFGVATGGRFDRVQIESFPTEAAFLQEAGRRLQQTILTLVYGEVVDLAIMAREECRANPNDLSAVVSLLDMIIAVDKPDASKIDWGSAPLQTQRSPIRAQMNTNLETQRPVQEDSSRMLATVDDL